MRTLKLYYYKLYYNCYSIEYIVKFAIIRFIGKGEVQGSSPCNSTIPRFQFVAATRLALCVVV